jgi:hypothetical protein
VSLSGQKFSGKVTALPDSLAPGISTPQDWFPTRWAGEFEQLSKDLLFSVDALLYGRVS